MNSRLTLSTKEILAFHGLSGFGSVTGREGEGGFMTRSDAISVVPGTAVTIDGQPLSEIWTEMQTRVAVFNRHASVMLGLLTFPVLRAQERVGVYANAKMEEATEFARPQKVRLSYIKRAFPLDHYDLGFGYTQEFLDDARGSEIRSIAAKAEAAWNSLRMNLALEAVFTETNGTDEDGLVVRRLYNGDGEVPPSYRRWTHDNTHTHYLDGGGTAFTATNFATIEEHLVHHGYGDNGETLVIHVNRADMSDVRGFANFIPAASASQGTIVNGEIIGQALSNIPPNFNLEGWVGMLAVVENNDIPSGYVFAHAVGGLFADENLIGLRSHENPSARGLRLIEGPNGRYPLIDAVYDGYAGAGVRHRGGGVVMQAANGGGYTDPTF